MSKSKVVNISTAHGHAARKRGASNTLSPEELARPGAALLLALLRRANELGHTLRELATKVGVTPGYLSQLRSGLRYTEHISGQFAANCAKYLGVPRIVVKLLSGQITVLDFLWPGQERERALVGAITRIKDDPLLGSLMPASVHTLPEDVRAFIVACYEQATTQEIMPTRDLPQMLLDLQHAAIVQGEQDLAYAAAAASAEDR